MKQKIIQEIYLNLENIIIYLKNILFKVKDNNLKKVLKKHLFEAQKIKYLCLKNNKILKKNNIITCIKKDIFIDFILHNTNDKKIINKLIKLYNDSLIQFINNNKNNLIINNYLDFLNKCINDLEKIK